MDQTNYRTIIHVDKTYLKFFLVKRLKEMLRNKFIKTFLQSQELCLYPSHEPPVHIQPVGEEGRGQGWWAGQHRDFHSRPGKCSFYRWPCFDTHILYYERSAYPFLFPSTIIAPSAENPKYHSELHLPRSSSENIRVIYDSGVPTQNPYFPSFTIYKNSVYYPPPTPFAGHISVGNTWRIPSCSLLSLEYSCHLVWAHAVKSSRRRCAPHRRCGPGLVWYHSLCQCTEGKLSISGILLTLSGDADSYLST